MTNFPTLSRRRWNRHAAAHLAVRAGFGPTPTELDQLVMLSPDQAVEQFLTFPTKNTRNQTPEWYQSSQAKNRFPNGLNRQIFRKLDSTERRELQQSYRKEQRDWLQITREWWIERMVESPHPLEEKLTLFWHGHFATSIQKVKAPYPMLQQNLTFREQGRGSWMSLLIEVSKDPAMLVYLDNARSNKRKPNENYARELMELFTLGEGNYSEKDIHNAARAFAGWSINPQIWEFEERPKQMDTDAKTFLNTSGDLSGKEVIQEIIQQPDASLYLAERMWNYFASDTPNKHVIADISRGLRDSDFDLRRGLKILFTHEDFYHPSVIRSQIKSPVQLTVNLVRTLNATVPPAKLMVQACHQLGQKLFEPPSVKGWDGGPAWITASNLSLRYKLAGRLIRMKESFNPDTLLPDQSLKREQIREILFDRFYHSPLREQERTSMDHYLAKLPPAAEWQHFHYVKVLEHLVQQPQFQLT